MALERAGKVRPFLWGSLSCFRHPGFLPLLVELEGDPNGPVKRMATFLMGNMFSFPLCFGPGKPGLGWRESLGYSVVYSDRTDSSTRTIPSVIAASPIPF